LRGARSTFAGPLGFMPHVLITNDDGIHAAGLRALASALDGIGRVSVVAPDQERSAASQSLTLRRPIFFEEVAANEWAVEGTPTDAMIVALHQLFPEPPDLVISGINRGDNLGDDVFYSGTVGAAMEATLNRVPAVAMSLVHGGGSFVYEPAARFARQLAERILADGLPPGVVLNVNVPQPWAGGVRFTRQSKKITRTALLQGTDPRGRTYYWLNQEPLSDGVDPASDYAAVCAGDISITPLELDLTHEPSLNHLSHWANELKRPQRS
jgi:5'-nucleotidase